jgi:hypothetical protein
LFVLLAALLGGVVGHLLGGATVLPGSTTVALRTYHDTYGVALVAGERWLVKASSSDLDTCAVFTLVWLDRANNVVALRTCHGRYVTAMDDQPGWDWELRAETDRIGRWKAFTLVDLGGDLKALKTAHGRYVTAMDDQPGWNWELRAETDEFGRWGDLEWDDERVNLGSVTSGVHTVTLQVAEGGGGSWGVSLDVFRIYTALEVAKRARLNCA